MNIATRVYVQVKTSYNIHGAQATPERYRVLKTRDTIFWWEFPKKRDSFTVCRA